MSLTNADFKGILDELLEGCQIIGPDWTYLYVNDALARHGRKTKQELLGRRMMDVYPGIEKTEVFEVIKTCMETGKQQKLENLFVYEDGTRAWFLLSVVPVPEGVFVMSLDISDQKAAQEEILKLNAGLEHKVAQRTEEVKAVNKELESFAYSVSHDLRAPLRAVDGFARILESDYSTKLDEEGKRLLSIVITNVRKMDTLIMDLLTLSRVTRGAMELTRVNMREMAGSVFQEVAGENVGKIRFAMGPLPEANGDPVLLRQVWANLISNAVKYSSPKERPEIEITAVKGSELVYSVRDNGVGFDPKYVHKLFGVFQRLHRDDEFPGTGVGLAIVERIILRHHGRVWAEGSLGHGAAIHFSLPDSNRP